MKYEILFEDPNVGIQEVEANHFLQDKDLVVFYDLEGNQLLAIKLSLIRQIVAKDT